MRVLLLVAAIVLFLLAGIIAVASATLDVAPLALVAFGLAAFAAAGLPLP